MFLAERRILVISFFVILISSFLASIHSSPSSLLSSSTSNSLSRSLYDVFPARNGEYRVRTVVKNITEPSGVALGYYKGVYGVFISSTFQLAIYFYNDQQSTSQLVAGVPFNSGSQDGQMLYSTFSGPTRMAFDQSLNRLFVTDRTSGYIRILDFNSDQVQTLYSLNENNQLSILLFERSIQTGGDFPGLDIQISNSFLYIVDTVNLYQGSIQIRDGVNVATIQKYTSLSQYMNIHGYPIDENLRSCVYSVAPDERRKVLYVSISYAKNVILKVPMNPAESYEKISVLLGDEKQLFQGNVIGTMPPITRNGNINNQNVNPDGIATSGAPNILLSFPLHMRLSYLGDTLYFSEAYPTTSDGQYLFGSLTIRRYKINTGEVDTYCGVDFSNNPFNESYYNIIGSQGGYHDANITSSLFRYPMSIAIVPTNTELASKDDKNKNQNNEPVFHVIYVADHSNGAVRKIFPTMNTPSPTLTPTTFHSPSSSPTLYPTTLEYSSSPISFFENLSEYEQILFITGIILLGLLCCFCCFSCFYSKYNTFEGSESDLESSTSSFFRTPKKNFLKDYVIQRLIPRNTPYQSTEINRRNSRGSDDRRNGLLDVSISSSNSSVENEEWDDMVWDRSPNMNISKQYRLSELTSRVTNIFHSTSDSSQHSNGGNIQSELSWSTVTPFVSKQESRLDISDEFPEETSGHRDQEVITPQPPPAPTHKPTLLRQLTSWWYGDSKNEQSIHEIQLNDNPSIGRKLSFQNIITKSPPKSIQRRWNSSTWDEVNENVVTLQFDD